WMLFEVVSMVNIKDVISGGGYFIKVDGVEIFDLVNEKNEEVKKFIKDINDLRTSNEYKIKLLDYLFNNWDTPVSKKINEYYLLENFRSRWLYPVIRNQLNLSLAQDLGFNISEKKFIHLAKAKYNEFLTFVYGYEKKKHEDSFKGKPIEPFMSEKEFRNRYYNRYRQYFENYELSNLKNNYRLSIVNSTIKTGSFVPTPDIIESYRAKEHKVKVDFALYTYENFSNDPIIQEIIKKKKLDNDIKDFYNKNESTIRVKKASFTTTEEANTAKKDSTLFKETKESNTKSYPILEIKSTEPLYYRLRQYKIGDITDIIPGINKDKQVYIYKILPKVDFSDFQKDLSAYKELVKKYAESNYEKFKSDFETRANELLKAFQSKVKAASPFSESSSEHPNLKLGRTNLFSQIGFTETGGKTIPELTYEGKTDWKDLIRDFLYIAGDGEKHYNKNFFLTAFSLKVKEISTILNNEMLGKKVFFIIRKEDEKLPTIPKDIMVKQKEVVSERLYNDIIVNETLWTEYLRKYQGYSVKVNMKNIITKLNLSGDE
ncbi:MAG: hypothetical protein OEV44_07450, partial [Spirochaetota bacterium]|nr:hypothetical protein [Spirochaetota bacterium]